LPSPLAFVWRGGTLRNCFRAKVVVNASFIGAVQGALRSNRGILKEYFNPCWQQLLDKRSNLACPKNIQNSKAWWKGRRRTPEVAAGLCRQPRFGQLPAKANCMTRTFVAN